MNFDLRAPVARAVRSAGLPGVCLVIIGICLWLLVGTFRADTEQSSAQRIGAVANVRKTAQRRAARRVIFETVRSSAVLAQGDTVRTGQDSEALLRLSGGTDVRLDELSMVVLHIRGSAPEVDVKKGNARVVARGRRTILRLGDRVIEIVNSTVVLKEDPVAGRTVLVETGSATVRDGEKSLRIDPGRIARLGGRELIAEEVPVYPTTPAEGATLVTEHNERAVHLLWRAPAEGHVLLEWGSSTAMGHTRRLPASPRGSFSVRLLPGRYFWRVGRVGGRRAPVRSFRVVRLTPPALVLPQHESRLRASGAETLVSFAFAPADLLDKYKLIVASDRALHNGLRVVPLQMHSIAVALPQGGYYWTIAAEGPGRRHLQAPVRSFQVVHEEPTPPRPLWPAPATAVSLRVLSGPGILFRWGDTASFGRYRLEIASDRSFSRPIFATAAVRPFVAIRRKLALGTCYWRVVGLMGDREFASPGSALTVQAEEHIELRWPAPGARFEEEHGEMRFGWSASAGPATYRLLVDIEGGSFAHPVFQQTVRGLGLVRAAPSPGRYTWKVQLLQADRVVVESSSRRFSVFESIAPPQIRFPGSGSVVDMSKRNSLSFYWNGAAASYTIVLDRISPGPRRRIFAHPVHGRSYSHTNLTDLDEGDFVWSVRAHSSQGRVGVASSARFRIRLGRQPPNPKVVLPSRSGPE